MYGLLNKRKHISGYIDNGRVAEWPKAIVY